MREYSNLVLGSFSRLDVSVVDVMNHSVWVWTQEIWVPSRLIRSWLQRGDVDIEDEVADG